MSLLLAALLSFQQSDEQLRAIVERFNTAIQNKDSKAHDAAWHEARRAGPAILKHLAAGFPGRSAGRNVTCGTCGWVADNEYPVARLMVSFGEAALPFLFELMKDADPAKARVAAAVMCRYQSKEIVGPLLEFSESRDLAKDPEADRHVAEALSRSTFLHFRSRADMAVWFKNAKSRSQVDWLWEAIGHGDPQRANRESTVNGIHRLLDAPNRLKALLRCFVDLGWREAGFALYQATGHVLDYGSQGLWDADLMAREQAAWKAFGELPEADQKMEVALHSSGGRDGDRTWALMTPTQAGEYLVAHAEEAFDYLKRIAPKHFECRGCFRSALSFVSTASNWERVEKFFPYFKLEPYYISQVFEGTRHPSMADKMLEMVIAGAAESMTYRGLMTELPKRVRPDMVPKILQAIPKTEGRNKSTLLDALGATGDPRGWDVIKKEVLANRPYSYQAAQILENFPGDDAVAELRKLLKSPDHQGVALAARILADRGDLSGVPALLSALETGNTDEAWHAFLRLSEIRGLWPEIQGRSDPGPSNAAIAEFKGWWEKNKSRPRVEWLLDSLDQAITSQSRWGILVNPLGAIAHNELKEIPVELPQAERMRIYLEQMRAWVVKTGFTFNKDTVRVPYRWK
jgi:hypothetical protein